MTLESLEISLIEVPTSKGQDITPWDRVECGSISNKSI